MGTLANQNVKIGPLKREWIFSIAGFILIPLLYVAILSRPGTSKAQKAGVILLIVIIVFFFIRNLFFKIEATQNGVVIRKFLIQRSYTYGEIDEIRIINHATKPQNTVEIRSGGKRAGFYNDVSKNSDLFIEKLRLNGIEIHERRGA